MPLSSAPLLPLRRLEIKDFMVFFGELHLTMAWKPLEILKKGVSKFLQKIKDQKKSLDAKLSWKETISLANEHWLDHEANTVDEQHIIDDLKAASDYERGLARLDDVGKAIVQKLREWAGDLAACWRQTEAYVAFCVPIGMQPLIVSFFAEGSEYEKQVAKCCLNRLFSRKQFYLCTVLK